MMEYTERITHCTFTCRNYEETVKFYSEILGMPRLFALPYDDGALELLTGWGFDVSGECAGQEWLSYYQISEREFIELFHTPYDAVENPQGGSFHHLCLLVDDIAAAACELAEKGVTLYNGPEQEAHPLIFSAFQPNKEKLNDLTSFFIRDPEGNVIEIMQGASDDLQNE